MGGSGVSKCHRAERKRDKSTEFINKDHSSFSWKAGGLLPEGRALRRQRREWGPLSGTSLVMMELCVYFIYIDNAYMWGDILRA